MAPKNKFTREEVVQAALRVVQARGGDALTAKAVADELGVSTRPIFSYYDTMEALRADVRRAARSVWDTYLAAGLREAIPFLGFGMQYIRFARQEPWLYRLLFFVPDSVAFASMTHAQAIVRPTLQEIYRLSAPEADLYFRNLWLVVHGLASLIVTGSCPYGDDQIRTILTGFSLSTCKALKEIPGFAADAYDRDAEFRKLIAE